MQTVVGVVSGLIAGALACLAIDRLLPRFGDDGPFRAANAALRVPWATAGVSVAALSVFAGVVGRERGDWRTTLVAALVAGICWAVSVIDLRVRRIPNVLVGALAAVAVAQMLLLGQSARSSLLGGLVGGGTFLLLYLLGRGAMGLGDVKFVAAAGLLLGYSGILIGMLWGILAGGVAAIVLLITRRAGRKDPMAYGPYLALGVWAYWIVQRVLG